MQALIYFYIRILCQHKIYGMTEEQMILVRSSWKTFRNVNPSLIANVFYSKLFFDNPKLRKMFPEDMDKQHLKFVDMLNVMISRIDSTEDTTEKIKALAKRHVGYGVRTEHYQFIGNALLWTIEKGLGNDWNDAIKEAWDAYYNMIAGIMIEAANKLPV